MPSLGPMEIVLIILVIAILFGWNKMPDAARSLGRSMRIFKSEVEEMKKDKPSAASRDTVPGSTVPPPQPTYQGSHSEQQATPPGQPMYQQPTHPQQPASSAYQASQPPPPAPTPPADPTEPPGN